jgi:hypothetical protein
MFLFYRSAIEAFDLLPLEGAAGQRLAQMRYQGVCEAKPAKPPARAAEGRYAG